jgi:hypothetical protein
MARAEEQRWVKSDKNKEYGYVGVRWAKNAGDDDEGEKQTVLEKESDGKLATGCLS